MNDNKVILKLGKDRQEYAFWRSAEITSALDNLDRSFRVDVTYRLPQRQFLLDQFKPGDRVQLFIDSDLILTGYIDQIPIGYDGSSVSVSIVGRSRTEYLVDCNPLTERLAVSFDDSWVKATDDSDFIQYQTLNLT